MSRMQAEVHPSKKEKARRPRQSVAKIGRARTLEVHDSCVRHSTGDSAPAPAPQGTLERGKMRETRGPARGRALGSRESRGRESTGQNMNVAFTFKNPMVELYLPSALGEREGTLLVAYTLWPAVSTGMKKMWL